MLLQAAGRVERAALEVELSARQELQREKRVGRAADPKVDLEGVDLPLAGSSAAACVEVDAEAADDAAPREDTADAQRRVLHHAAIRFRRREATALVDLAGRPAEDLVVRRQEDDLALRVDAKLCARRRGLRELEELLDDSAHPLELAEIRRHGLVRRAEAQPRNGAVHGIAIPAGGIA